MSLKERLNFSKEPVYLIDGSAFIYRAFYAFPDLKRSDGFPTNALFIVLRLMLKILREEKPEYIGFILDARGPSFRNEIYPEYKAQREAAPEDMIRQLEPIKEGLKMLGMEVLVADGEADDLIASLAAKFKKERPVVIVGADKDLKQCLDHNVVMWDPAGKKEKLTTLEDFRKDTGLEPEQWPDFQAVIGDSSDNIPGVPGVGPKTAEKIFENFKTLEQIKEGLDQLKPAQKKKLEEHIDKVFTYRELTTLRTDEAEKIDLDAFSPKAVQPKVVADFLQEYQFRSLLKELRELFPSVADSPTTGEQGSLFGDQGSSQGKKVDKEKVKSPNELPDFSGKTPGLIRRETGLQLGVDDRELDYVDSLEDAVRALATAKKIYAPDVKKLYSEAVFRNAVDLNKWFDVGLASYLLNPEERDYSLFGLQKRWGPEIDTSADNPALFVLALGKELETRLDHAEMHDLMYDMEMPLIPVLAEMERNGISIDKQAFSEFLKEVEKDLERLTKKVYDIAGGPFNLRSSQQLAEVLFDTLGLKPSAKTPGGAPSTSQKALEKLEGKHPIIEDILEFRKLEKLRSTYLEPLPKLADKNGRIHTTFNQTATATGRLSSSNPNLQNIPIRGKFGRRMRSCFTASESMLLIAADYSQIELRVLAHMSKEPALLESFRQDEDIHRRTAALLYDKEPEQVEIGERRNAKTVNFGLIYGMGPQKLARDLQVTVKEAKEFIEKYFEGLKGLKAFYEEVEAGALEHGYVVTLSGRRRLLPDIHSRNAQLRAAAQRRAVNTVIQGSAADLIKVAMIRTYGDVQLKDLGARLLLQVHDELVMEAPQAEAQNTAQRLETVMAGVGDELDVEVPLRVDCNVGKNWDKAE